MSGAYLALHRQVALDLATTIRFCVCFYFGTVLVMVTLPKWRAFGFWLCLGQYNDTMRNEHWGGLFTNSGECLEICLCLSLGWICSISVHECAEQRNSPSMVRHMHSWKGHQSEVDYSESAANWHSRPFPGKISLNVSTWKWDRCWLSHLTWQEKSIHCPQPIINRLNAIFCFTLSSGSNLSRVLSVSV